VSPEYDADDGFDITATCAPRAGADPRIAFGDLGHRRNPLPVPVAAACRARLDALQPAVITAACAALDHAVRAMPITGAESDVAAVAMIQAAVTTAAGPGAPWEVVKMLRRRAELQFGRLQLLAVDERLGQQRAHWAAEGGVAKAQPWGPQELHFVLSAARHSNMQRVVQGEEAAERGLSDDMARIEAALAKQELFVAGLAAVM